MNIKIPNPSNMRIRRTLWSLLCLLLTGWSIEANAQEAVVVGSQITAESQIVSGKAYVLKTGADRYITDNGTNYDVPNSANSATEASVYHLISNGDGTWKIKNYYTEKYWGVPVYDKNLSSVAEASAGAWSLNFSNGIAYPQAPDASNTTRGIDRSDGKVWGWSTGNNDNHKVYIYEVNLPCTATLKAPINVETGWYLIKWVDTGSDTNTDYAASDVKDRYIRNYETEVTVSDNKYSVYLSNSPVATKNDVALSLVYFNYENINSGRGVEGYLQSSNGHFVTQTGAASSTKSSKNYLIYYNVNSYPYNSVITSAYTGTRYSLIPRGKGAMPYIGQTVANKFPMVQFYAVDPADLGLQPWTVVMADGDDAQATYSGSGAYGLTTVYNGGTFFLTSGLTPSASDFSSSSGAYSHVVVNPDKKTITFQKSPLTSLAELETGWYQMKFTTTSESGKYVYNNANENNYSASTKYPLTFQTSAETPDANNGLYYVRFIRNDNKVQIQSTNGHYLGIKGIAEVEGQDLAVVYNNGFKLGGYLYPYGSGANNIVGGTDANQTARFALYPIDLSEQSRTAWRVIIANNANAGALTCTRGDVSGLTTVYEGGYFILPSNVTPIASDFTMTDLESVTINTEDKTITALLPDINGVTTSGGHQTTGVNNTNAVLERIKIETVNNTIKLSQMTATLKGDTKDRVSRVAVYKTPGSQFKPTVGTDTQTLLGATTNLASDNITITLDDEITLSAGDYLWLVADINNDNTLIGTTIDAKVTGFTYTSEHVTTPAVYEIDTDPAGTMTIFKTQSFVFTPNRTETEYYRIPAIITTADGGIVALADQRHDHPYDLGKNANNGTGTHVIDVVARKSTDGGLTWGDIATIATGDGTNAASYGYGDAAIVRDANGTLHCMMAAGSSSYANGMLHVGYTKSTDDGAT